MNSQQRILVVDDEQDLRDILQFHLSHEGFAVDTAASAQSALELHPENYNLLLLDVMMEGMNGFELARQLKQQANSAELPIIFLTAKDTETDLLEGFQLGADDYIAKPFSLKELTARIRAVLHRTDNNQPLLSFKGLEVHPEQKYVIVDNQSIGATPIEYQLMELFLTHRNRIYSREELIDIVWPSDVIVTERTVDVNITRLRKKLGAYAQYIVTRTGHGYGFFTSTTENTPQ